MVSASGIINENRGVILYRPPQINAPAAICEPRFLPLQALTGLTHKRSTFDPQILVAIVSLERCMAGALRAQEIEAHGAGF